MHGTLFFEVWVYSCTKIEIFPQRCRFSGIYSNSAVFHYICGLLDNKISGSTFRQRFVIREPLFNTINSKKNMMRTVQQICTHVPTDFKKWACFHGHKYALYLRPSVMNKGVLPLTALVYRTGLESPAAYCAVKSRLCCS